MELNICHLYPDILNLYGDRGNILCMQKRLEWRGIGVTVTGVSIGQALEADITDADRDKILYRNTEKLFDRSFRL